VKHNKHSPDQTQPAANSPRPTSLAKLASLEAAFTPSPDEVARRAYFTYVNEGSHAGHEVQHWLQAESELISERNRTREHHFHNQT